MKDYSDMLDTANIIVDNNKTLHYLQAPNAVHCFILAMSRVDSNTETINIRPRTESIRKVFPQGLAGKLNFTNTGPNLQKTFPLQIVKDESPDITNKVNARNISHKTMLGSAMVLNSHLYVGSKKRLIH